MNNYKVMLILIFVLLAYLTMALIAWKSRQRFISRKILLASYIKDASFLFMINGGDDPCKFAESKFECGNYIEGISFVVEED